eukprot:gene29283-38353_t
MGVLVDECLLSQKISALVSMVLSLIAMIVTYSFWATNNNDHSGWLGKLNNTCVIHAVLMVTGMGFCYTQAVASFRVMSFLGVGHDVAKGLHGFWHTSTIILVITALVAIINFHNDQNWGHLTTMHSWLGILLLAVYSQNWLLGIFHFLFPWASLELRKNYLPSHRFFGIVGLFLAAVVMETGIAQKHWIDGTNGCMYTISTNEERQNPATGYMHIGGGCRAGLGVGVLLIFNCIFAVYALWDFRPVAAAMSVDTNQPPRSDTVTPAGGNQIPKYVELATAKDHADENTREKV